MWNKINNNDDIIYFMNRICFFHDSCIKEMKYLSGAYVEENLSMYPINDRRVLRVVIQRQFEELSMVELEFVGLKYLRLVPKDENYTCEILDSTMIFQNDCIYWCDCENLLECNLDSYKGTVICATEVRWREINGHMGNQEFYKQSGDGSVIDG